MSMELLQHGNCELKEPSYGVNANLLHYVSTNLP